MRIRIAHIAEPQSWGTCKTGHGTARERNGLERRGEDSEPNPEDNKQKTLLYMDNLYTIMAARRQQLEVKGDVSAFHRHSVDMRGTSLPSSAPELVHYHSMMKAIVEVPSDGAETE